MAASNSLPHLTMASMAAMPSSAAQLMFFPFFNGNPLGPAPPIGGNGVSRMESNSVDKYSPLNSNVNQMYSNMKMSSHTSSLHHFRDSKPCDSPNIRTSGMSSEDESYGLNAPLNLSKPKLRTNTQLSPTVDLVSRMRQESPISQSQVLSPHEAQQMAMFDNSYWNPLSLQSQLKKNPFNGMALHPNGLELMPPIDGLNMYLANNSVPPMIVNEPLKKENPCFNSAPETERKTDSVITCQSKPRFNFDDNFNKMLNDISFRLKANSWAPRSFVRWRRTRMESLTWRDQWMLSWFGPKTRGERS